MNLKFVWTLTRKDVTHHTLHSNRRMCLCNVWWEQKNQNPHDHNLLPYLHFPYTNVVPTFYRYQTYLKTEEFINAAKMTLKSTYLNHIDKVIICINKRMRIPYLALQWCWWKLDWRQNKNNCTNVAIYTNKFVTILLSLIPSRY